MYRLLLILLFSMPVMSFADKWLFPDELNSKVFTFGDLTIERSVDARENRQYPLYYVKVFRRGEKLASYRNLTFDVIRSFDDGKQIFAGSNSGTTRFAYFVLDSEGGLVEIKTHSDSIPYCKRSISVFRKWLPEKVEIKETYRRVMYPSENIPARYFVSASIKICNGEFFEFIEH